MSGGMFKGLTPFGKGIEKRQERNPKRNLGFSLAVRCFVLCRFLLDRARNLHLLYMYIVALEIIVTFQAYVVGTPTLFT
jgi:hypothetical protein